jgi:hypothetical protein
MGCCSSFTAYRTTGTPDPLRHVNYVTGMVLGVDDYAQEFAYHAGRAKWIVREFLGYGTLSGLAVRVVPDGDGGAARVHVAPGSAATPGGQLICVGREQCGEIGAWFKRADVKTELDARADGAGEVDVEVYLKLCFTDCPVDDVPIPGEPCRSEENLMAPSRVADDYSLSFSFERPLDIEARALEVFAAWRAAAEADAAAGGETDPANFAPLVDRACKQILTAMGVQAGPVVPGDLDPVVIDPAMVTDFLALLPRAWITVIRPMVMSQSCASGAVSSDDCLMLTRLRMTAKLDMGSQWVAPAAADIVDDQSERRFMLSAMALQSAAAPALAPPPAALKLGFYNDDSADPTVPWPMNEVVVAHANPLELKLTVGDAAQPKGAVIMLRHCSAVDLKLGNAERGGAGSPAVLKKRGLFRLVYDGAALWQVSAVTEEAN